VFDWLDRAAVGKWSSALISIGTCRGDRQARTVTVLVTSNLGLLSGENSGAGPIGE
jgi:hypothetical protein